MKPFTLLTFLICIGLLTTSCLSGGEDAAAEIQAFRAKASTAGALVKTVAHKKDDMRVSFVGNCVTISSVDEILNMVMETSNGEVTVTNLGKRSGMFCSPDEGTIRTVWVSTKDKKVSRFDANSKYAKTRNALAYNK